MNTTAVVLAVLLLLPSCTLIQAYIVGVGGWFPTIRSMIFDHYSCDVICSSGLKEESYVWEFCKGASPVVSVTSRDLTAVRWLH